MAERKSLVRPRNALDAIIAATAAANACIVVTDNERDFASVESFNPVWGAGTGGEPSA